MPAGVPRRTLHFGTVDEDFTAYGLLTHRHTPEMEQILGAPRSSSRRTWRRWCAASSPPVTPARPRRRRTLTDTVLAALHDAYDAEPFVVVTDDPPSTKATSGSNVAHVTARVDPRTGWVISLCALDNLVKGASGQAIQCANAALGLPETTGLPLAGVVPVSVTAPEGFVAVGGSAGIKAARRTTSPSWPPPTAAPFPPPASSPPTWPRPHRSR